MWSILENVPCELKKNVYSAAFGWNALYVSFKSIWSIVLFKACMSVFILCLDDLSIGVSGVLKFPTIIVFLLLCFYYYIVFIIVCFYYGDFSFYVC